MSRTANPDSPTKKKLLAAAERLMLEKGFTATTIDDICDKSKLTKGSFFHYFKNKDDLGLAVLDHTMAGRLKMAQAAPRQRLKDPVARILRAIDGAIETSLKALKDNGGCLIGTFAQELSYTHPAIRDKCSDCLTMQAQGFLADFKEAKKKYAPHSSIDPESLAKYLVAIGEGSLIVAKAKQDPEVVRENLRHFKQYIQFLFGKRTA